MGKSKKRNRSHSRSSERRILKKENRDLRKRLESLERDRAKRHLSVSNRHSRSPRSAIISRRSRSRHREGRSWSETNSYRDLSESKNSSNSRQREGRSRSRMTSCRDPSQSRYSSKSRQREGHSPSEMSSRRDYRNYERPQQESRSPSVAISLYSRVDSGIGRGPCGTVDTEIFNASEHFQGGALSEGTGPAQEDISATVKIDDSPSLILMDDSGLSEETRNILGPDPSKLEKTNFKIHAAIDAIWSHILAFGIPKDEADQLFKKYDLPENCKLMSPPKINPEIGVNMNALYATRDETHLNYQKQLGKILASLGGSMNKILEEEANIPKQIRGKILANMADAGRMLCSLFNDISLKRRQLISPLLNKQTKILVEKFPPGEYLFGSELGEKIHAMKLMEKVGKDIRPAQPTQPAYFRPNAQASTSASVQKKGRGTDKPQASGQLNRKRPTHPRREMRSQRGRPSHSQRQPIHRRH